MQFKSTCDLFLISHIEKAKIMRQHVKDILTILIKKYIPATVHNLMRKMKHLQSKITTLV